MEKPVFLTKKFKEIIKDRLHNPHIMRFSCHLK